MRKPHYLNWDGVQVLALYDGMREMNEAAIQTMEFDEVCLFAGDFPDLSIFASTADRIKRLSVSNAVCEMDFDSLKYLKELKYLRLSEACSKRPEDRFLRLPEIGGVLVLMEGLFHAFVAGMPEPAHAGAVGLWGCPAKDLQLLSTATQFTT